MIIFDARVLKRSKITGVERYAKEIFNYIREKHNDVECLTPMNLGRIYEHIWTHTILPVRTYLRGASVLFCPVNDAPFVLPRKVRLVVTIHDLAFIRFPEMYSWSFRTYYRLVLPIIIKRADRLICISKSEESYILDRFPEAIGKTKVIYHGVSDKFSNLEPLKEKKILAVASFNKHKNLKNLLLAFERIMSDIPHSLTLVGSPRTVISSDDELEAIISRLSVSGRIALTGYVTDDELRYHYATAEVFVFPSYFEGFGLPILEAMSSKCVVCCSNTSAMPEVAGEAAVYFDPSVVEEISASIIRVTEDKIFSDKLRELGYLRAKQFSWIQAGRRTLDVLLGG